MCHFKFNTIVVNNSIRAVCTNSGKCLWNVWMLFPLSRGNLWMLFPLSRGNLWMLFPLSRGTCWRSLWYCCLQIWCVVFGQQVFICKSGWYRKSNTWYRQPEIIDSVLVNSETVNRDVLYYYVCWTSIYTRLIKWNSSSRGVWWVGSYYRV